MFYTYLKINSNYVQKVILLMISNKEKEDWYYLTAKKISVLFAKRNKCIV